jgi:hypothetical protein
MRVFFVRLFQKEDQPLVVSDIGLIVALKIALDDSELIDFLLERGVVELQFMTFVLPVRQVVFQILVCLSQAHDAVGHLLLDDLQL